ncbi:M14 family metallopeptidase [Pokkaliibacter sp. MBI-7]|uniref:succinylglutamate desuccinylase/aspartoacylase family protein n=1 Tax=Pokkaliibacter sp. MBI-7 TaxID=3040600 RepID=UPI002447A940|nr:M14 family metallopeptidase [Pokkaliibacter sp. MBI-7]MDH2434971.1 M14 family metallopeptidase [Pokkaliibacter sp. MBI-7]
MQTQHHPLKSATVGTSRSLTSLHYSNGKPGPKVYIQAGLHADENPGMLVLHYLRPLLQAAEDAGQIRGEIVVVPFANPIGLNQTLAMQFHGRFEFGNGQNFNRNYRDLAAMVTPLLEGKLGADADSNVAQIRAAMRSVMAQEKAVNELDSMRLVVQTLACDADIMLDLHCDSEAILHLYIHSDQQEEGAELARYLGSAVTMHAPASNGQPFDESASGPWAALREAFPDAAIPMACFASTVEYRGQKDVSTELATDDAERIFTYLRAQGAVDTGSLPARPELPREVKDLAATDVIRAPVSGIVEYHREPGEMVREGDALVSLIDPLTNDKHTLVSGVDGLLYARNRIRFAHSDMELTFVSGDKVVRSGYLLSAR